MSPRSKRWIVTLTVSASAVVVLGLLWAPIECAYQAHRGAQTARDDLAHGNLQIRAFGLPANWHSDFRKLLEKRYGIQYKNFGCVVTGAQDAFAKSYNEVVEADLLRKFGRDVIEECAREAEENWNERLHSQSANPETLKP